MQMMSVLKPIAFDVILCMSQLFDYYLYAVSQCLTLILTSLLLFSKLHLIYYLSVFTIINPMQLGTDLTKRNKTYSNVSSFSNLFIFSLLNIMKYTINLTTINFESDVIFYA